MATTTEQTLRADIEALRAQGGDILLYAASLASHRGVEVAIVEALMRQAGPARIVDAETVAQERLAAERRQRHTTAYRRWNGEE